MYARHCPKPRDLGDFRNTAEPHVACCTIFATPFEECALNPFPLFASLLSDLQFFELLSLASRAITIFFFCLLLNFKV